MGDDKEIKKKLKGKDIVDGINNAVSDIEKHIDDKLTYMVSPKFDTLDKKLDFLIDKISEEEQKRADKLEKELEKQNVFSEKIKKQLKDVLNNHGFEFTGGNSEDWIEKCIWIIDTSILKLKKEKQKELAEEHSLNDQLKAQLETQNRELDTLRAEVEDKTKEIIAQLDKLVPGASVNVIGDDNLWFKKIIARIAGVQALNVQIETLTQKLEVCEKETREKTNELNKRKEEIEGLNNTVRQKENEIDRRNSDNKKLKEEIGGLNDKIAKLDGLSKERLAKIGELEGTIAEQKDEIEDKTADNERLEADLRNKTSDLNDMTEKADSLSKCLREFEDAAEPYLEIYRLMIKCGSMANAFETMGIPMAENITRANILKYINAFAGGVNMARIIYNSLYEDKKEITKQPITAEERRLIDGINNFYKANYGGNFEENKVLDCLGITGDNEVKFDQKNMRDLDQPRNPNYVKAEQIFVPLLRADNGIDVAKPAIIRGK